ncbi:MAG: hypothetical protein PV358_09825 [Acidimicrobiales bacterium]|nr:hypothetical protein [Acidimicrobiales bacterium]
MSEEESPAAPATAGPRPRVAEALRWLVVAVCVGSAVVHFAYAPTHLDEEASHGAFFLTVAWAQLGVAFALARWREVRWPWLAAAGVNAAVIAVWLVSRTAGVPGSDAESVGFPDALATGLEAVAVVGALLALRPALSDRPMARLHPVVGGVAARGVLAVVSASITPSIAGEHHHGGGDGHAVEGEAAAAEGHDHGATQALAAVDPDARCDLGFNTAAFNEATGPGEYHAHDDTEPVDFTLEEWAEVFVDPEGGLPADVVVDFIEQRPVMRDGILSGGLTHTLEPDPWNPLTDPDECAALADELTRAREVAATYPTIADAEAAGYRKVTTYYPGIAAHYMNFELLRDGFVLEEPEMLLYDGDGPTASIVGLSYYILKSGDDEPAEGFTGDNDHYHRHVGLCIRDGVVAAGSNTSDEECGALGGDKSDGTAGWMSHVWITPGCESDWGVFSGANPALTVRTPGDTAEVPTGCGSGLTMDDPLAFDDSGEGPSI